MIGFLSERLENFDCNGENACHPHFPFFSQCLQVFQVSADNMDYLVKNKASHSSSHLSGLGPISWTFKWTTGWTVQQRKTHTHQIGIN